MEDEEKLDTLDDGEVVFTTHNAPSYCLASLSLVRNGLGRINVIIDSAMTSGHGTYASSSTTYSLSATELEALADALAELLGEDI